MTNGPSVSRAASRDSTTACTGVSPIWRRLSFWNTARRREPTVSPMPAGRTSLIIPDPLQPRVSMRTARHSRSGKTAIRPQARPKTLQSPRAFRRWRTRSPLRRRWSLPTARFATRSPTTSFRSSWEKIRISSSTWSESCSWRWVTARAWTPVPTSQKRVVTRG